jgi:hypothetical protein
VHVAHGWVERREQQVLREHSFARQSIEKRRLSRVGIADERNHRPRRTLATVAVQRSRPLHLIKLAADLGHPIADQASVGLDLGFARSAEEAETAALPLEVGPAPDQPACLLVEMGQLDLKAAFRGGRPLPKNLEDQSCPVDHLGPGLLLQILLLDRGQSGIDNEQPGPLLLRNRGNLLDLPLAEQGRGPDRAYSKRPRCDHVYPDCFGEALGLLDTSLGRPPGGFAG